MKSSRSPRDRDIEAAVRLISPPARQAAACREDVDGAFVEIKFVTTQRRLAREPATKKSKQAADRLARALQRVETALKSDDLEPSIQIFFPRDEIAKWLAKCERQARLKSKKPARSADAKDEAAENSLDLMLKYGRPVATTKGSPYLRLAALLSGEPLAVLQHQCRAAVGKRKSGRQTVPVPR